MPFASHTREIIENFPSYRDFVDDALFHPEWGYYSTGRVQFGEGGHYDTYPNALSPLFGHMIATYGFDLWQRLGEPADFEIAEIGAGNGQLSLDTLLYVRERHSHPGPWRRFADLLRYRIIERSKTLIERQKALHAGADLPILWTRADLSQGPPRRAPLAQNGLIVANEVLDCLAHEKIITRAGREPRAVFVVPSIRFADSTTKSKLSGVPGHPLPRTALATHLSDPVRAELVRYTERTIPVSELPDLERFLAEYTPELFSPRQTLEPYFACPDIPTLLRNSGALFKNAEALWIDYGSKRRFHLRAREDDKVFAGPPRSWRGVYDSPGADDITFMVDFTTTALAAVKSGWTVEHYGPQGELARRARFELDDNAAEFVLKQRGLKWLLSFAGIDPEADWRASSVSFDRKGTKGGTVRKDVRRALEEFSGKRRTFFKIMILRRP